MTIEGAFSQVIVKTNSNPKFDMGSHEDWIVKEAATKCWRFLNGKRTDSLLFSDKRTYLCLLDLELHYFLEGYFTRVGSIMNLLRV